MGGTLVAGHVPCLPTGVWVARGLQAGVAPGRRAKNFGKGDDIRHLAPRAATDIADPVADIATAISGSVPGFGIGNGGADPASHNGVAGRAGRLVAASGPRNRPRVAATGSGGACGRWGPASVPLLLVPDAFAEPVSAVGVVRIAYGVAMAKLP